MDRKRNTARIRAVSHAAMSPVTETNGAPPKGGNQAATPNKRALLLRFWRTLRSLRRGGAVEDREVGPAVSEGRMPSSNSEDDAGPASDDLETDDASQRSGPATLTVTCGSKDGTSMRIRVLGGELEITDKQAGLVDGQIVGWVQVGVIAGVRRDRRDGIAETAYRYWLLEPGGSERRLELGPFKVVGRFIERETTTGKAASDAWRALERPAK